MKVFLAIAVVLALAVFLALKMTLALGTALVPLAPGNGPAMFEQDCWRTDFSTAKKPESQPRARVFFHGVTITVPEAGRLRLRCSCAMRLEACR